MASIDTPTSIHGTSSETDQAAQAQTTSSSQISVTSNKPFVSLEEFVQAEKLDGPGLHSILVGGGPRTTAQEIGLIEALHAHAADFEKLQSLGAEYEIRTTIIERQSEQFIARGNAWGPNQGGGTVNTSPEGGQEHKERLTSFYKENKTELEARYLRSNPIAAATFSSAFAAPEGTDDNPSVGRAALLRVDQGKEEHDFFLKTVKEANIQFPFYKLSVIPETSVHSIDLSNPQKPAVLAKPTHSGGHARRLMADMLVLNTGTTSKNPVRDVNVSKHTFSQAMDPEALKNFLNEKGLMDADRLKPGTKLALGGTSLSLYDELIALQPTMNLVEPDSESLYGYRVTEEAKRDFQGALTAISNTAGKWAAPRHANSPAWMQERPPLGSPAEQHAMFLHQDGSEIFRSWNDLMIASVANTLKLTPQQVMQKKLSTEQLLQDQATSSEHHASQLREAANATGPEREQALKESTWTLEGARRQAYLSSLIGLGMATDLQDAAKKMAEMAPLTFADRAGYIMGRAQGAGVTTAGRALEGKSNQEEIKQWNINYNDLAASPFRVHILGAMLLEAGILKYETGAYDEFKAGPNAAQISLKPRNKNDELKFDAFIVAPVFDRRAEPALTSLRGQVKPVHPQLPDLGEITANRMLLGPQGSRLPVQDFSYNNTGAMVNGNKVGFVSFDVGNRDSAYEVAPGLAKRRMAQAHLAAARFENPIDQVERLYDKHAAISEEDYAEEVTKFAPHFESGVDKSRFVNAMREAAGDDAGLYERSVDLLARTKAGRDAAVQVGKHIFRHREAYSDTPVLKDFARGTKVFDNARQTAVPFQPSAKEDFFKRFIDYPQSVHDAVYKEAFEMAYAKLDSNRLKNLGRRPISGELPVEKRPRT